MAEHVWHSPHDKLPTEGQRVAWVDSKHEFWGIYRSGMWDHFGDAPMLWRARREDEP